MKMKKMMFLMLTLFVLGAANVNAQVTIGSDKAPHSGAVLDLQSDNLGLKLPNVALDDDLTVFGLPDTDLVTDAKGMYVYNTNPIVGEGVYVWDGYQWILVKASKGEKPVTGITILPESGYFAVMLGSTLQLATKITPNDADNPKIVWSTNPGSGYATISNTTNILTPQLLGTVQVRAEASSGVYTTALFHVIDQLPIASDSVIGSGTYGTYIFGDACWMVENSKEGDPSYRMYNQDPELVNGYYYAPSIYQSSDQAVTPCSGAWRVPTTADWTALVNYLSRDTNAAELEIFWRGPANYAGISSDVRDGFPISDNSWQLNGQWAIRDDYDFTSASANGWSKMAQSRYRARTVRCIHR